jgi:hypothetical protein
MSRRAMTLVGALLGGAVAVSVAFMLGMRAPNTDWLKNMLASGSATIDHEGQTYLVGDPLEVRPGGHSSPALGEATSSHRCQGWADSASTVREWVHD